MTVVFRVCTNAVVTEEHLILQVRMCECSTTAWRSLSSPYYLLVRSPAAGDENSAGKVSVRVRRTINMTEFYSATLARPTTGDVRRPWVVQSVHPGRSQPIHPHKNSRGCNEATATPTFTRSSRPEIETPESAQGPAGTCKRSRSESGMDGTEQGTDDLQYLRYARECNEECETARDSSPR